MPKTSKKKKRSVSLNRRLMAYPSQKYFKMFVGYCRVKFRCKATMLFDIIKLHFDNLPESEQVLLLRKYDAMSEEEKSRPSM